MKFHVILGKKQIVLASLVVILSIAVYLNYTFAGVDGYDLIAQAESSDSVNYGEAQMTGASVADEYFITARLDRKKARDEAVETLAAALRDADLSDDEREIATSKALAVSLSRLKVRTRSKPSSKPKALPNVWPLWTTIRCG